MAETNYYGKYFRVLDNLKKVRILIHTEEWERYKKISIKMYIAQLMLQSYFTFFF